MMSLASSVGVWRCVSVGSVFGGFARICSSFVFVHVFRLDPSYLHSSSATVTILVCWFYGALAQRLPDCLLQQGLPGSGEGGAMTAARLRLASVLVVIARWSTDLDVIFIISRVRCTTMIEGE